MNRDFRLFCICILLMTILLSGYPPPPPRQTYVETFEHGPGGWYSDRYYPLKVWDGVAYCNSPWWLDANHAPPGAGYLHMLMWLYTDKKRYKDNDEYTRGLPYLGSRFADQGFSRNLTNARLKVRLRGDVDLKGSQMVFVVQAKTDKSTANFVLTGQPFKITHDWSEKTAVLAPDPKQWTCLGARHDMTKEYGCDDIAKVLKDVNLDIIFALFPLKSVPACNGVTDIDKLRASKDYVVDQQTLPKGLIMFDTVSIQYPR